MKHHKVFILIDSGSTHKFIERHLAQEIHCYVQPVNNFQILAANGFMMYCGGRCENVKLEMGDYRLKSHMFTIDMGGCDIVLGAEWISNLGLITMDFQELYMNFTQDSQNHTLDDLQVGSPEITNSHRMEKLVKKGHYDIISHFVPFKEFNILTQKSIQTCR